MLKAALNTIQTKWSQKYVGLCSCDVALISLGVSVVFITSTCVFHLRRIREIRHGVFVGMLPVVQVNLL